MKAYARPGAAEPETTEDNLSAWDELDELTIPEMFAKISEISDAAKAAETGN